METTKPTRKRAARGHHSKSAGGAPQSPAKGTVPAVEAANESPHGEPKRVSKPEIVKTTAALPPARGEAPRSRPGARVRAAKRVVPRVLIDAPPGKCFWVNFGPILRNLRDLRDALAGELSEQQYLYHVVGERNDFAAWVEAVLLEPECAAALRRAKTRLGAARAVGKHLERP